MKLYQYPKCSSCRKAVKFLNDADLDYESLNLADKAPSKKDLKTMLAAYDGELKKLFNTSGLVYREMGLKDKLGEMSVVQAIDLLANNGMLVKRPFLLNGTNGVVGFNEDAWKHFLG